MSLISTDHRQLLQKICITSVLQLLYVAVQCQYTTTIWTDDFSTRGSSWSCGGGSFAPYTNINDVPGTAWSTYVCYLPFTDEADECESNPCLMMCSIGTLGSGYNNRWLERTTTITSYSALQFQFYAALWEIEDPGRCQIWYKYNTGSWIKAWEKGHSATNLDKYSNQIVNLGANTGSATTITIKLQIYADSNTCDDVCFFDSVILKGIPTPPPIPEPTNIPTTSPTNIPSKSPIPAATNTPITSPTHMPTTYPTNIPSESPTTYPTNIPSESPTTYPTNIPSESPTLAPTISPTFAPSIPPSKSPISAPTYVPSAIPTITTLYPSKLPTVKPTASQPSIVPTTDYPSNTPTKTPIEAAAHVGGETTANFDMDEDKIIESQNDSNINGAVIVGIIVGIIVVIGVICLFCIYFRKKSIHKKTEQMAIAESVPAQSPNSNLTGHGETFLEPAQFVIDNDNDNDNDDDDDDIMQTINQMTPMGAVVHDEWVVNDDVIETQMGAVTDEFVAQNEDDDDDDILEDIMKTPMGLDKDEFVVEDDVEKNKEMELTQMGNNGQNWNDNTRKCVTQGNM